MARTRQRIELRAPDLAHLTPDQREMLDHRIADALEFIMTFPLENNDDKHGTEAQAGSRKAKHEVRR